MTVPSCRLDPSPGVRTGCGGCGVGMISCFPAFGGGHFIGSSAHLVGTLKGQTLGKNGSGPMRLPQAASIYGASMDHGLFDLRPLMPLRSPTF